MLGTGKRESCTVALVAFSLVLVASGCTKKLAELFGPPSTGTLLVTTATGGTDIDPDGYELLADGWADEVEDIGANDTVEISVFAGDYTVTLSDVAANCSVDVNPQVVTVPENSTARITFNVTCS